MSISSPHKPAHPGESRDPGKQGRAAGIAFNRGGRGGGAEVGENNEPLCVLRASSAASAVKNGARRAPQPLTGTV
jgi:hypothetical protein